eukprot:UN07001
MSPLWWCLISICYDDSLLLNTPINYSRQTLLQLILSNVHTEHSPRRANHHIWHLRPTILAVSAHFQAMQHLEVSLMDQFNAESC